MAKKTIIRRASKTWPLSSEQANAFQVDEFTDLGDRPSDDLVFDAEFAEDIDTVADFADDDGAHQEANDDLAQKLEDLNGRDPTDAEMEEAMSRAAKQAERDQNGGGK